MWRYHTFIMAVFLLLTTLLFLGCEKENINPEDEPTEEEKPEETLARGDLIKLYLSDIRIDSLESYVRRMEQMGTRFTYANNRRNVAITIRNRFIEFGYANALLDSFKVIYNNNEMWQYNVIATLPGTVDEDSVYIIGGHYDCINIKSDPLIFAPGANDNASGVATTLEVARVMKKRNFKPRCSIKFIAFGAEEKGLRGSWDYSNKATQRKEKISMMLNNDMVANWPGFAPGTWTINIIDYPDSEQIRRSAYGFCQTYTTLRPTTDNTYRDYSDSLPFSANGYRALFFISDADDPNYHTSNDIADNCNFNFCAEVARLNYAILLETNIQMPGE